VISVYLPLHVPIYIKVGSPYYSTRLFKAQLLTPLGKTYIQPLPESTASQPPRQAPGSSQLTQLRRGLTMHVLDSSPLPSSVATGPQQPRRASGAVTSQRKPLASKVSSYVGCADTVWTGRGRIRPGVGRRRLTRSLGSMMAVRQRIVK
jgi:hypothetical protein